MNCIFSFYNYIADYTDRNGKDFHNEFQIPKSAVKDETDGARSIKGYLLNNGYIPRIIVCVKGNYTMAELKRLAEGKLCPRETLINCIKAAEINEL